MPEPVIYLTGYYHGVQVLGDITLPQPIELTGYYQPVQTFEGVY